MKDKIRIQKKIKNAFKRLEKEDISAKNKQLITNFSKTRLAEGTTRIRVVKIIYSLRFMAKWLKKDFNKANKQDLIDLVGSIEAKDYAEHSKYDFKIVLKQFYKWLKDNDEHFPPEIAWLKPKLKNGKFKLPEELLTPQEVERMAEETTNSRDRALILVLYESGCRIGELLSLRLKNLRFDQHGVLLRVTGKTGDRRVRVIASSQALTQWLQEHPDRKNPEAPLWPPRSDQYQPVACCHQTIYRLIRRLGKKAKIHKKVYPHLFRHSRATALASKLTDSQMKEFFGWTQSSKMASVYIHLSGRDVDKALLRIYGIEQDESEEKEVFVPRACPRCKQTNSPSNKYCARCGSALDLETALRSEEKHVEADKVMNQLLGEHITRRFLAERLLEINLSPALCKKDWKVFEG